MNNNLTDVKLFTKKQVTISAIQWTGNNLPDVIKFTGKHPRWGEWFKDMDEYVAHVRVDGGKFKIFTLEGVMDALPGDWIIRGVQGEHYPCKPDIFAATYEEAELQERRKADSAEPVADVVAWASPNEERKCDIRWRRHDVAPGPLYAAPQPAPVVNTIDETLIEALRLVQCMLDDYRERNYGHAQEWIRHISAKMDDYSEQHGDDAYSVISAAMLQAGNPPVIQDGWQLVPKEPTEAMNKAGWAAINEHDAINPTYRAMLAAAPQQDVRLALEIGMSRYAGAMQKLVDSGD